MRDFLLVLGFFTLALTFPAFCFGAVLVRDGAPFQIITILMALPVFLAAFIINRAERI